MAGFVIHALGVVFWVVAWGCVALGLWLARRAEIPPVPAVLGAYLLGLVVGVAVVLAMVRVFPNTRYRTKEKIDGFGYVWTWGDFIMPYLMLGVLALLALMVAWLLRR